MKRSNASSTLILVLAHTTLLCTATFALPRSASAQVPSKIVIAHPGQSIGHIGLHVAQQRGFFRDEGLDAQLVRLAPPAAIKALAAGDAQVTTVAASVIRAIERDNVPFKVVSIDQKQAPLWLTARPEIKSVADLKGKIVGLLSLGSPPHVAAVRLLREGGVDPEQEVTFIATDNSLQSLVSGAIQAAPLGLPQVILARDKFKMNVLAKGAEEFPSLDIGLAVREDLLREKRDLIKRTLRALSKARRYVMENEQGTSELLAEWTKVELPVALESYRLARDSFTTNGIPTEAEVRVYLNTDAAAIGLPKPVPADRVFDFSLQREVNAELGAR